MNRLLARTSGRVLLAFVAPCLLVAGCRDERTEQALRDAQNVAEEAIARAERAEKSALEAEAALVAEKANSAQVRQALQEASSQTERAMVVAEAAQIKRSEAEAKLRQLIQLSDEVENENQRTIENVIAFLNTQPISAELSEIDSRLGVQTGEAYRYYDFQYLPDERALVYKEEFRNGLAGMSVQARATCLLSKRKLFLDTASALAVEDQTEKDGGSTNQVWFRVDLQSSQPEWSKKEWHGEKGEPMPANLALSLCSFTDTELRKIDLLKFGNRKQKERVSFKVNGELAPRLKKALEDLLKAHDVEIPTY